MSNSPRGFTLIEAMVAASLLAVVASSLLMVMRYAATENARTRVRSIASTDAQTQLDRMIIMSSILSTAQATDATRCSLFEAAGGPMDTTTGGTASGTCPTANGQSLTVTGIRLPGTLKRKVTIDRELIGTKAGLILTVEVSGSELNAPVVVTTQTKL